MRLIRSALPRMRLTGLATRSESARLSTTLAAVVIADSGLRRSCPKMPTNISLKRTACSSSPTRRARLLPFPRGLEHACVIDRERSVRGEHLGDAFVLLGEAA